MRREVSVLMDSEGTEEYHAALKILQKLFSLVSKLPEQAHVSNSINVCLFRLGMYNEAILQCQLTRKLDPMMPHAYSSASAAYLMLNRPYKAIEEIDTALHLALDDWRFLLRGRVYLSLQDYITAFQSFQFAHGLRGNSVEGPFFKENKRILSVVPLRKYLEEVNLFFGRSVFSREDECLWNLSFADMSECIFADGDVAFRRWRSRNAFKWKHFFVDVCPVNFDEIGALLDKREGVRFVFSVKRFQWNLQHNESFRDVNILCEESQ